MAERSVKARLSSTVVVPHSNRRERRERKRSPDDFRSHRNRQTNVDYNQHDDRVGGHDEKKTYNDNSNENRSRRIWQNEQPSVKERLGFVRDREQQPRMIEINTDPRDVPRGKRYFEHDDRESSYGNQNFNNVNRRRSFPRQRSRSPVWKHDHFEEEPRRVRPDRRRQPPWRQRERNAKSPVWKHDKFEEFENEDKKDDDGTRKRRRSR